MKIHPVNDWVLLRPMASEKETAGGIVIPESAQEKPTRGEVQAVGRGRVESERDDRGRPTGEKKFIETELKAGQTVLFRRYGADEVDVGGEKLLMVREGDILGIL